MNKIKKISEKEVFNDWVKKLVVKTFTDWKKEFIRPGISNVASHYWTMILTLDSDNNIYYWEEFRYWNEDMVRNFPWWRHEPELTFEENALKELKEELWATSDEIIYLWESIISGFEHWIVKYFLVKNCIFWEQELEETEDIKINKCSLEEFEQKIVSWEINCPLTISCYTKAKLQNKI